MTCQQSKDGGGVELGFTRSGTMHTSGIMRCGSPWACPMCAPLVRERRARQLDELFGAALAEGCVLAFVTATVQHTIQHDLQQLLGRSKDRSGLIGAWRRAMSGRGATWDAFLGQVKAVDLTVGEVNGWHPHLHVVMVFKPGTDWADVQRWLTARRTTYLDGLSKTGLTAAADSRGWHVRRVSSTADLSGYLAKVDGGWGAGLELARGDLKSGMRGGRTIWQVLNGAMAGNWDDAVLWCEHERVTKGRRLIVCSRRLAELFGVTELVDEEDGEGIDQAPDDAIVYNETFTASAWGRHVEAGTAWLLEEAARRRGAELGLIVPLDAPPPDDA